MKSTLYTLLLLALSFSAAQAQTSTIGYRTNTGTTDVEKHTATESQLATSFTFGSYTSSASGASSTASTTNDIFLLTNTYSAQVDGRALIWRQNNSGTTLLSGQPNSNVNAASPLKSTVLLTFNREVSNLSFVIQDIDLGTLAGSGGSDYTDEVDFYALNGSGNRVDLAAGDVKYGATASATSSTTCAFQNDITVDGVTQDAVRGTGLNGTTTAPSRTGNVTVTFANPVKSIRLSFRNLNTLTSSTLRLQTIGIEQISWTQQADVTTTISNSTVGSPKAGADGKFTVNFSNVGDLAASGIVASVQLNKNLNNVVATNGGVYSPSTGLVSYSGITALAYQAVQSSVITYTLPAVGTVVTAASAITTTTSEGLNPNANSAQASVTTIANGSLPVELSLFEAKSTGSSALLNWNTASEKSNDYFAVERSLDGSRFEQIGTVKGQGNTATLTAYTFTDASLRSSGRAYYRLRQVDFDGSTNYSPVRVVNLTAATTSTLSVYPSPATADQTITLDLQGMAPGSYQLSVLDAMGQTLRTLSTQGGSAQVLPVAGLPAGTYLVVVQGATGRQSQRLVLR